MAWHGERCTLSVAPTISYYPVTCRHVFRCVVARLLTVTDTLKLGKATFFPFVRPRPSVNIASITIYLNGDVKERSTIWRHSYPLGNTLVAQMCKQEC